MTCVQALGIYHCDLGVKHLQLMSVAEFGMHFWWNRSDYIRVPDVVRVQHGFTNMVSYLPRVFDNEAVYGNDLEEIGLRQLGDLSGTVEH